MISVVGNPEITGRLHIEIKTVAAGGRMRDFVSGEYLSIADVVQNAFVIGEGCCQ